MVPSARTAWWWRYREYRDPAAAVAAFNKQGGVRDALGWVMRVLVTGGTGKTGSAVACGLRARGHARDRQPQAERPRSGPFRLGRPGHARRGAADIDAAYLVAPALVRDPAPRMVPFIDRAIARGTRRFVLLSSSAIDASAPGIGAVHAALAARRVDRAAAVVVHAELLRPGARARGRCDDEPRSPAPPATAGSASSTPVASPVAVATAARTGERGAGAHRARGAVVRRRGRSWRGCSASRSSTGRDREAWRRMIAWMPRRGATLLGALE